MMLDKRCFYIDGQEVEPDSAQTCEVVNPAMEEKRADITMENIADLDKAVAAPCNAFAGYSMTFVKERLSLLEPFRRVSVRWYDEVADVIILESGASWTLFREQHTETSLGHLDGFITALKAVTKKYGFLAPHL